MWSEKSKAGEDSEAGGVVAACDVGAVDRGISPPWPCNNSNVGRASSVPGNEMHAMTGTLKNAPTRP
jgi:hypothetical protein